MRNLVVPQLMRYFLQGAHLKLPIMGLYYVKGEMLYVTVIGLLIDDFPNPRIPVFN